ncbi:MAG: RimK family alpha-L-glutamate ligase, partial [Candidatus Freyarchaeota archaeon]|nr:RimK family alpha-L-glutamate ligase [Candidatus Jordarchaeia archaeon]
EVERILFGVMTQFRGYAVEKILEALGRRGLPVIVVDPCEVVSKVGGDITFRGRSLMELDALIFRGFSSCSAEQVFFRMDLLHSLEGLGVFVVNSPTSVERASDKYYTSFLLERAGVPTPRTVVTESFDEAMRAFREMGDVVVKPLFGSQGKGVVRVSDEDVAYRVFKALALNNMVFYIQEFIPHGGRDIRAFTIGGSVAASIYRVADGWKTNVSQGGKPVACKLTPELEEMSVKAAETIGCEYAGVDIVEGKDGAYVLEVNATPTWEGIEAATGVPIADMLVDHVIKKLSK